MKYNKITFYTRRLDLDSLDTLEEITNLWKNHKISNFQYLMQVNKYAGRSYLDPANYPVFPWIISTYDCQKYTYRDLSKTMGALVSNTLFRVMNKGLIFIITKCSQMTHSIQFPPINTELTTVLLVWSLIS